MALLAGTARAEPWSGPPSFFDDFRAFRASPNPGEGWMTTFPRTGAFQRTLPSNGELQFYSDRSVGRDPFAVRPDGLHISAEPGANAAGLPYTSGLLTSFGRFQQLYGYFEVRARLPAGKGLWPAFWLLPADRTWPPEIDVMEVLGQRPSQILFTTHSRLAPSRSHAVDLADSSAGFHDYGMEWRSDTITWFFDRRPVASEPTPKDMHKPMFLLLNLAVGGKWPGTPDAATHFPAEMVVARVQAFPAAAP